MHPIRLAVATLLLASCMGDKANAQSFGRWHVPSTTAQFFGCGYGPGHHVPMVRVPGYRPMRIARLTLADGRSRPPMGVASVGCESWGDLESLPVHDWCPTGNCSNRPAVDVVPSEAAFFNPPSRKSPELVSPTSPPGDGHLPRPATPSTGPDA